MKSYLQPKSLCAEVVAGVDIGKRVWLAGDRVTIGRDFSNDLVLDDPDIAATHLTLTRQRAHKRHKDKWAYALVDHPANLVDGTPSLRSGWLGPSTRFQLGGSTQIAVQKTPLDDTTPQEVLEKANGKTSFPIPASARWALNLLALVAVGLLIVAAAGLDGTNKSAPQTQDAPRSLNIEQAFCAVIQEDALSQANSELVQDLNRCQGRPVDAVLPDAERSAFRTALTAIVLRIEEGDTFRASDDIRRLSDRLGVHACNLSTNLRSDIVKLAGGMTLIGCGTE